MPSFRTVIAPLTTLAVLAALGCGDRGARDGAAGLGDDLADAEPGGTAILVEGADMSIPIAIVAQSVLDGNLGADVMNMELVRGMWEDGRLVYRTADENPMAIARRYELLGPDSASLRFHMRSDVVWSDGTPLTAHDVEFTYGLIGDPELASPVQNVIERLDSVTVQNDSTVTFHFDRRYPEMLGHSAQALVPRHVFEGTPVGQFRNHPTIRDPANGNMVVSGPYMIGQWERGQRIVLVRNPHFRPQALLDQIVIRIVPEATTRQVELQTGNVDMVNAVTFDQLPALRAQAPQVRFEREEKRFYDYIAYNPEAFEGFRDPEVRRALGLAIDADAIIRALQMEEFAVPAGGPYAPIFPALYDPQGQAPLPHDPERARQLLAAAGWTPGPDGILRNAQGRPFRFTLTTNAGNQRRADATQIIQQQWRQVGVDAQLRILEFNAFQQGMVNRTYEASLGGWSVGLLPDLTPLWGPDAPFNITGYRNPEVTSLMEQARAQTTAEAANPLWRQAASRIAQDQPYTWLWYLDSVNAVHNRLRNTLINTYGIYQNTWEWWIPQAQRRGGGTRAATPQDTAG
jgi:peptide/nickel transport system substrate-binding protein